MQYKGLMEYGTENISDVIFPSQAIKADVLVQDLNRNMKHVFQAKL